MSTRSWLASLPGLLLVASCGARSPVAPESHPFQSLPSGLSLTASASGTDGALTATCRLLWTLDLKREISRTPDLVVYGGNFGGESFRSVVGSDQSGVAFDLDVFGEIEVSLTTATGAIAIRIPVNERSEQRFSREQAHFNGPLNADGTRTGTWNCAPLDISEGHPDTTLTVPGTWQVRALTQ